MRTWFRFAAIGLVALAAAASTAIARPDDDEEDWKVYEAEKYGFKMLVPAGAKLEDKEFGDGWGGLHGKHEGVELVGVSHKSTATPEEIEKFGVSATKIASEHWKKIDEGKDHQGFKWWRAYLVHDGDVAVVAMLGSGSKASYLLFLKTTWDEYEAAKDDFKHWYNTIEVE